MSTVEREILTCAICCSKEGYIRACHFCGNPICTRHAHYMTIEEDSVRGVSFKTIRICENCKPSQSRIS